VVTPQEAVPERVALFWYEIGLAAWLQTRQIC